MDQIAAYFVALTVLTLVSATSLWLAAKITRAEASFIELLVIAAITAPLVLLPSPLDWSAVVVLFLALHFWAKVDFWPDAALMVVVARFLGTLAFLAVLRLFG